MLRADATTSGRADVVALKETKESVHEDSRDSARRASGSAFHARRAEGIQKPNSS